MAKQKVEKVVELLNTFDDINYKPKNVYYHRSLALLSILPYKKPKENYYEKTNGNFTISVNATPKYGLPYGSYPRLIFLYLYSYCYQHKTREVPLGNSIFDFLNKLDIPVSSVSYKNIRKQCLALFNSTIQFNETTKGYDKVANFLVADSTEMFWQQQSADDNTVDLFQSTVKISEKLYNEFQSVPVPAILDIVNLLKNSAWQLDLYFFLTYRVYMLNKSNKNRAFISNAQLQNQFGANYKRVNDFKRRFKINLSYITTIWTDLKIKLVRRGMIIYKSPLLITEKK